jgi:DNA-binding NarL/FixJ family response regulator
MQKIKETSILSDIVVGHEDLIPILSRLGVRFGLGNSNINEISRQCGIQTELLICIVNMVVNPHFRPKETLQTFSVMRLIDYLKKENEHIVNEFHLLEKQTSKSLNRDFGDIVNFFKEREQNLYPKIEQVYETYYSISAENNERLKVVDFCEEKQDEILKKLSDFKQELIKNTTSKFSENELYTIVCSLTKLEKELKNHKQIEFYLLKSIVREMESNIRKARKKQSIEKGFHGHIAISPAEKNILSYRETQILKLVAKGFLNKEIAGSLKISLHTVISHRKNISRKLSLKSASELTVYAMNNGMI